MRKKILRNVAVGVVGLCFLYMAIAALGEGSSAGVLAAFFGMFMWAMAERESDAWQALAHKAVALAAKCLDEPSGDKDA